MRDHFILKETAENDLLAAAAYVAEGIPSGDDHSEAMSAVIPRYLARGDVDLAAELANAVDDPFVRDRLLIAVAAKCAEIDDDEYALQLIDAVEDPGLLSEGMERLGMIKARSGQIEIAEKIAGDMLHPEFVLASIAVKQADSGDFETAAATVDSIGFPGARVTARCSIAQAAISENGSEETAIDFLSSATEDAVEVEHDEEKVRALIEIGNLFIEAERNDKAIETFDKARELTDVLDNIHRDAFFASVSVGFLRAGSQDLADRALDLVADKTQMANALLGHARHFWRSEQKDEAIEALDEAYEMLRSQKDIETRSRRERFGLFTAIAAQFAGFERGERAIEIAEGIEDDEQPMVALAQIARILTMQKNDELARQALNAIHDEGQRVFALIGMSDEAVKQENNEKAIFFLEDAAAKIDDVPQLSLRTSALTAIADRFHELGKNGRAGDTISQNLELIARLRGQNTRAIALAQLADLVKKTNTQLTEADGEMVGSIIEASQTH